MLDVELVVVNPMEEHVHTCQVVRRQVDLLPQESVLNDMLFEELPSLEKERP